LNRVIGEEFYDLNESNGLTLQKEEYDSQFIIMKFMKLETHSKTQKLGNYSKEEI
jgi:hypothetical protein